MGAPRKPPSCIECFFFLSDVLVFTNFFKQTLCHLSLFFSSPLTGILPFNTFNTQSQIQWTSSSPATSIIWFRFCLQPFTSSSASIAFWQLCTRRAITKEWSCVRSVLVFISEQTSLQFHLGIFSFLNGTGHPWIGSNRRANSRKVSRLHPCILAS